jgi:metabolite-proton symporter
LFDEKYESGYIQLLNDKMIRLRELFFLEVFHLTEVTNRVKHEKSDPKMAKKAVVASTVGTIIEWYDFFLYATASALIFPKLFFVSSDPYVSTLQSFGTFAVGYFARPIGAAIFGHFGDRIGRKNALVITLWLMGLSSLLMGILPTYESIGFWAPVLLIILRILQGIGVGGEWAGSILLSMEWGSEKKRGFMASLPNTGVGAGLLVSSAMVTLFMTLSGESFYAWGWRLPFIFSLVLLIAGLVIRSKIEETPSFRSVQDEKRVSRLPVLEVMKTHPKQVILSALVKMSEHAPFSIFTVFMINYSMQSYHIDKQFLVNANTIASLLMCINMPIFGYYSDKIGIKRMYLVGVVLTLIWAFPYISLMNTGVPIVVFLATVLSMFPHNIQAGAQGALIAQSFPARLRYSGASLGTQLSSVFSGGIAPIVCTYLIHKFGTVYSIGFYIAFTAIVSLIATILIKDFSDYKEEREFVRKGSVQNFV